MGTHDTNGDSRVSERPMGTHVTQRLLETHETKDDSLGSDRLMETNGDS